ncbi:MAG: helix-turn-helix transcriptional regulator [Sphingomicrobium sp.]
MNNRLKVLRAQRDWSQSDLAARLEVSRQSVNAIETGKYDPSLPLAFRIAELFELTIEEIFDSPARHRSGAI